MGFSFCKQCLSHSVLSNVERYKVMLPLPDCHSHNLRMVVSLPSNSSNICEILREAYCSLDSCGCNPFPPPNVRIKILLIKEWWFEGELTKVIYYVQLVIMKAWLSCFRHDLTLIEFAHGTWLSGNSRCGNPTKYYQVCLLLLLSLVNTCINQASPHSNLPSLLLHTWSPWSLNRWVKSSRLHYYFVIRRNVATKTTLGTLVIPNK